MEDAVLYLHIGLPKTATTYLQKEVFPILSTVDYFDKPDSDILRGKIAPMYGIMDRFFSRSATIWEEMGDQLFTEVLGLSSKDERAQKSILISDEGIGAKSSKPIFLRIHLEQFASKCAEWGFQSIKILCVVRRQDQWLASHYTQLSDRKVNASQKQFEAYIDDWLDPSVRRYADGMRLDYSMLRNQLVEAVGSRNVLILPYELLHSGPSDFLRQLLGFVGFGNKDTLARRSAELADQSRQTSHNKRSRSDDTWKLRRRPVMDSKLIRLRPTRVFKELGLSTVIPIPWPETGRGMSIQLTKDLKQRILDTYAESNRRLAADISVDLSQHGYY